MLQELIAQKDPQATLDYTLDWGSWLVRGDTIQSSTWAVQGAMVITNQTSTPRTTTVWVAGGELSKPSKLTNTITTAQGRVDQRTITIYCADR